MPRGDIYGARNLGLPARSRATPTAAMGVLDRGRRLHPANTHPSAYHLSKPTDAGSGCGLCKLGLRCSTHRSNEIQSPGNESHAARQSSRLPSPASPTQQAQADATESPKSADLSWQNDTADPASTAQMLSTRKHNVARHVDTGTPLGYSPAFEAYHIYVKDRWCTSSCLCLHHAAAADDAMVARAAVEGRLPFTRTHGLTERDEAGRTPIMIACWRGSLSALLVLVEGSDLDLKDKDSRTAFHWAALSPRPADVYRIICGRNSDCKTKDKFGDTCLHKVALQNDLQACEVLCENDPRLCVVKNKKGKTAWDVAKSAKVKAAVSVERARDIIRNLEKEAEQEAERLFEEAQKEAHRKKLEEQEQQRLKRGVERAQNLGGTLRVRKVSAGDRDDWDIFYENDQSAPNAEEKQTSKEAVDLDDLDSHAEIAFFSQIQSGQVQVEEVLDFLSEHTLLDSPTL